MITTILSQVESKKWVEEKNKNQKQKKTSHNSRKMSVDCASSLFIHIFGTDQVQEKKGCHQKVCDEDENQSAFILSITMSPKALSSVAHKLLFLFIFINKWSWLTLLLLAGAFSQTILL